MLYHNVQVMAHSLRFIDTAAVVTAAATAAWYGIPESAEVSRTALIHPLAVFSLSLGFYFAAIAERLHVYIARRTEDVGSELFSIAEVILYATGLACATTEILAAHLPGSSYLKALAAGIALLLGLRLAMRFTLRGLRRRGDDYRVWLIVGHNERAADIAQTVLANPHFGIRIEEIVNVAGDEGARELPARFLEAPLAGLRRRVLGSTQQVREIVATNVIDEVVVTLPVRSCYDRIREILDICCEAGISVKLGPEAFEKSGFSTEVAHVGSIAMVTHYSGPANYRELMMKRFIDFVGATLGLIILSPLLAGIALAVKLTSPGPVFFVQIRVGLHGRHFRMVKFRSMVKDADGQRDELEQLNEQDECAFKIRNDSRITPLGRWLRKYHLDELPQFWNVLVGDMSLVGPRPLPVREAFGNEWWQRRRLTMPPGLTCHWQLAADHSMPFKQWMELDMAYIDRWSLWLDMKLIARTFATVARGKGW